MTGSRHREGSYTREHLEGADFAGAYLSDADFSDADFRGTDFTGARLRGATFRRSSFGVSRWWLVSFLGISLAIGGRPGRLFLLLRRQ